MDDKIIKPDHYNSGKNDLIRFALANPSIGPIEFNVMKYVMRWKKKNRLDDLYKAREYLNRLISAEEDKDGKEEA
jgi:hypothetical protein